LPRKEQAEQIFSGVLRYGPYAMFALLSLFALLLKMLYVGRAQRYPQRPRGYAAHLVFGAHNHAFVFLAGALLALLPRGAVRTALILWVMVYLLLSMRAVYGGRWSCVIARGGDICLSGYLFPGRGGPRRCRHLAALNGGRINSRVIRSDMEK
jgi:hypothetical protein